MAVASLAVAPVHTKLRSTPRNSTMDVDNTLALNTQNIHNNSNSQINTGAIPKRMNYTLNREKQFERIIEDSTLPPFQFEVKDSGKAVTILCNSGTYKEVVKPFFFGLTDGASFVLIC